MAYTNSIIIKISLFALLLLAGENTSYAQKLNSSPYSYYGIGEPGGLDNPTFSAFGNNHVSLMDSTILNYYNPASYNLLSQGQPLFSFGLSSRMSIYSQADRKEFNMNAALQHIAMAFPIKKHFGLAFGMRPFSSRGYSFYSGQSVGTDSIVYKYSGDGTLNEVFAGISTDLLKFKSTRIAVGMNAGYVFGETFNSRFSYVYSSTALNPPGGVNKRLAHLSTFHYDLGFYINQKFRNHEFGISGLFDPSQKLKGSFEDALYYSSNVNNENLYDTISYTAIDDMVQSASNIEIGITYKYLFKDTPEKSRKLNSQLLVNASYGMTGWKNFNAPFNDSLILQDSRKLTFGLQYTPEISLFEKSATLKFYQKLHYRLGGYFNTLPYTMNGTQLTDKGITFGVGIPVPTLRSLSSINLGFTIGNRGNGSQNTLKENYYGINLGITIAPGISERWFRNLKLN